ncbi:MAG: FAD-dependent oxidoreductase [Actinobacteria bacterium]|nr:FAD-dependent oxidoreductase [Actinomycetota bacterium]
MNEIKFKRLFSEFSIKGLTLKNRIVFLPHTHGLVSITGLSTEEENAYYIERAKGGVGLIISGSYVVSKDGSYGRTFLNASDERAIPNFKKMVKSVHGLGTKIIGQISHAGSTKMEKPEPNLFAPSQVIEKSTNSYTIEMDKDNINEVIRDFRKSAENLAEGGFDGVEIKVAHDGLLRTFLSPYYNERTDEYGKDFEGRARIILKILSAIKEVIKDDMVLGARICLDEFDDEGYNLEDGIKISKYIAETGLIDYISSDAGSWNIFMMEIPPMSVPLGFSEYMSSALKKAVNLPVIAFGRINDPVQAEQILENGNADLIGMVRQLVCNPETPRQALHGQVDDIRKCIACDEGCIGQVMRMQPIRCIQNLSVGKEKEYGIGKLRKTDSAKKIVVVGGGVSGLKFSEIAAKRGHNIVLFEKDTLLGGQINLLKKIPFRNEFSEVIRYLEYQVRHLNNIDLRIPEEADSEKILKEKPDMLVIASGAEPFIPELFFNEKTITGHQLLNDSANIGKNIVIYDQLSKNDGMGIAEYLFEYYENIKVHYVTPTSNIGLTAQPENVDIILRKLMPLDFKITPYHSIKSVSKNKIEFQKAYSEEELQVNGYDNLIYLGSIRSSDKLYWQLRDKIKPTFRLGDAKVPACVELAIHDSEKLARSI